MFEPLFNRVLIKVEGGTEKKTASGLIIPESKSMVIGEIAGVGEEVTALKVGDKVYFNTAAGVELPEGEGYILTDKECIAKVK